MLLSIGSPIMASLRLWEDSLYLYYDDHNFGKESMTLRMCRSVYEKCFSFYVTDIVCIEFVTGTN